MQTFTREDKRAARADRFEQEARLAESRVVMQLTGLRRDTALAWLTRYYREQQVALLRQQRDESALLVAATEAGFRAGSNLQTDVFIARSELALMDDRISEADTQLTNAITALARWIGTSAAAQLGDAPAISVTRLQSDNLELVLELQPELLVLAQQEAVAQAEVELAQENKHEDWSVEFMLSRRDPIFGSMVSVGISRPLQLGQADKQDRELAAKFAMVQGARSERIESLRAYLAQTQSWLDSWKSNLERLGIYDTTLIPLALDRTQAALSAYRGNSAPLATVLDARRAEINLRLERLRIETETAELWAQLEFLLSPDASSALVLNSNTNPLEN
jgi:outer membrane protein TolC